MKTFYQRKSIIERYEKRTQNHVFSDLLSFVLINCLNQIHALSRHSEINQNSLIIINHYSCNIMVSEPRERKFPDLFYFAWYISVIVGHKCRRRNTIERKHIYLYFASTLTWDTSIVSLLNLNFVNEDSNLCVQTNKLALWSFLAK